MLVFQLEVSQVTSFCTMLVLKNLHSYVQDDGYEVRYGGLGLRQLGVAAAHCKLDPMVANFMKVLCSQEIYRYQFQEFVLLFPSLIMVARC